MDILSTHVLLVIGPIVMGLVAIAIALFAKPPARNWLKKGERCEGIVVELGYQDTFRSSDDIRIKDKITIRFVTKKQDWITADLDTNFMVIWDGQFREGQTVEVIYDPDNPNTFTLYPPESPREAKSLFLLIGLLFLIIGICCWIFSWPLATYPRH